MIVSPLLPMVCARRQNEFRRTTKPEASMTHTSEEPATSTIRFFCRLERTSEKQTLDKTIEASLLKHLM
ncbi:unnamed protein product [Cyprideis torosa]|uniref:Uncharacterized protein n=1 Tax=Cyprideis torosa TaxID=163714 RepID=A0A7R8ZSX2_9CRUS|nr:unnamed protein product [Cyprideis torosa]CAG0897055.1 unnamed protein product [Cyprideis torosa]